MGPVRSSFWAWALVTMPEAARILQRVAAARLPLFCMLVSAGLAVAAVAWGVVLLDSAAEGLGTWLCGSIWRPTYPLCCHQRLGRWACASARAPSQDCTLWGSQAEPARDGLHRRRSTWLRPGGSPDRRNRRDRARGRCRDAG